MDWEPEGEDFGAQPAEPYSRLARILNASLPLFRVGSLRVKLHWSFFLAVLVFASWTARAPGGTASTGQLLLWGLLQAGILYSLVLLHEFGHSWMAAAKGRPAKEIMLTPLGGAAVIDRAMAGPAMEAEVSLAGPGVNLLILGVSVAFLVSSGLPSPWAEPLTATGALRFAFWANLMLGIFNLAPAYPMDGGRVLRAFLSWRRGAKRGTRLACRVGQVVGALFIGYGIYSGGPFGWILASIGFFNILNCSTTIRMVELGLPVYEDYLPERGYAPERPKETREERAAREAAELERRLDELLDKVAREGMGALSLGERLFLRRASKHFRNRPPPDA
ncbi:MAG: M50 family metallopeptidase [Planctomycetota bacterium]